MTELLKTLPMQQRMNEKYELHLDIVGRCFSAFAEQQLKVVGRIEQVVFRTASALQGCPPRERPAQTSTKRAEKDSGFLLAHVLAPAEKGCGRKEEQGDNKRKQGKRS